MTSSFLKCENCKPSIMDDEGCCTANVGRGMKYLINRQTGDRLLVCALLTLFSDSSWGCGDWENRPDECRAFYCHRMIYRK